MTGNIAKILNVKESKNDGNPPQSVAILRNRFVALLTSGYSNSSCAGDEGCWSEDGMSSLIAHSYG